MGYPTLGGIKAYLGITDSDSDNYLTLSLSMVIEAIEKYCHREFPLLEVTEKSYNNCLVAFMNLRRFPVSAVTAVSVEGIALTTSDYKFDQVLGQLFFTTSRSGDFEITYTGGYDPIPPTIDYVIKEAVKSMYTNRDSDPTLGPLKSERVDGTVTLAYFAPEGHGDSEGGAGIPRGLATYKELLDPYRSESAFGDWG